MQRTAFSNIITANSRTKHNFQKICLNEMSRYVLIAKPRGISRSLLLLNVLSTLKNNSS